MLSSSSTIKLCSGLLRSCKGCDHRWDGPSSPGLPCENDLAERVRGYQRNEQQSNALANQRSDFVNMLVREQNEHALSLIKLKERFVLEEDSAKNMFALQLDTLAKEQLTATWVSA